MKKNGFAPILIILVIAILGVVGYFGYKNLIPSLTKVSNSSTNSLFVPTDIFSQVSSAINDTKALDKRFVVSLAKDSDGIMYWHTPEGYLIKTPNSQQVLLKYNCEPSSGSDLQPIVPAITTNIASMLKQNNFQRVGITSDHSVIDWGSNSFKTFGSDNYLNSDINLYCNLSVDINCGADKTDSVSNQKLYYTCSTKENYNSSYSKQIKPLSDMQLTGTALTEISSYQNYTLFDEHGEWGPGAYVAAKEIGGKWTKLFGGQDNPSCATADQYKIPRQLGNVLAKCVDSKGNLVDNPN